MDKNYAFNQVKSAMLEDGTDKEQLNNLVRLSLDGTFYVGDDTISIQFWGWEIVLMKDGTYFLNATDGG